MSDDIEDDKELISLQSLLEEHIKEAVKLRMGVQLPNDFAAVGALMETLLDVRARLDRLEEVLGSALRWKAAMYQTATACKVEFEDAWDTAASANRSAAARDEYSSARERAATVNLATLDVHKASRQADLNAKMCDDAVDYIRLRYNGLSALRHDLIALIKAQQFETSLER
jgi:hypothetical protein